MDELDFIEALSSEKTAGVKDQVTHAAKMVANWVKAHPQELAGMGIGGGLAGVGAYLASRPGKDGLSAEQKLSRSIDKKVSKGDGFLSGLGGIASKTHKEVADLAAKHPKAMALANVPLGAAVGRTIANKLKEGSVKISKELLETADQWGRELAQSESETEQRLYAATEKLAFAGDIGKAIGAAGKHIMKTPASTRALVGAGVGVAKNLVTSDDHNIASMAGDAALGAGAGLGARQGMKMLSGMKGKGISGQVGRGVRAGLKDK